MSSTPESKTPPGRVKGPTGSAVAHSTGATGTEEPAPRAGFVGIVGRPNVGKSTLLNQILGEKLAIASPRPQTTRTRLLGVKNLPGAQLALLDTPGLHRPGGTGRSVLNKYMIDEALGTLSEVDAVLVVTDLRSLPSDKSDGPDD